MIGDYQFVTDAQGHKTAVIVPIERFEEFLEDIELGQIAKESRDDPGRPLDEVLAEMRVAGELDV